MFAFLSFGNRRLFFTTSPQPTVRDSTSTFLSSGQERWLSGSENDLDHRTIKELASLVEEEVEVLEKIQRLSKMEIEEFVHFLQVSKKSSGYSPPSDVGSTHSLQNALASGSPVVRGNPYLSKDVQSPLDAFGHPINELSINHIRDPFPVAPKPLELPAYFSNNPSIPITIKLPVPGPLVVGDHMDKGRLNRPEDGDKANEKIPLSNSTKRVETIYVSVASFRDDECSEMIWDMYTKADHPQAVFVGLIEQHFPNEKSCLDPRLSNCQLDRFCPTDNIRRRLISPKDAKGPTYGRYMGSLLYRGETYYMQVDSHNHFIKGWDTALIEMHKTLVRTRTQRKEEGGVDSGIMFPEKAVLTHYPEAYNQGTPVERQSTSILCKSKFLPQQRYLRFDGIVVSGTREPVLQPYSAAGFIFSLASLIKEVPLDPHLSFIFDGEEILYSVRMWTSGYDLYSPSKTVLVHSYGRPKAPRMWNTNAQQWTTQKPVAEKRVQYLLKTLLKDGTLAAKDVRPESLREIQWYGLGKQRSLEEYYRFAGVDPALQTHSENWCSLAGKTF